jgi:serine/threonine protein kinase
MSQRLSACLATPAANGAEKKEVKAPIPVLDRYELLELIGGGSMGTVYKGRHRGTAELVAVKMIIPDIAAQPDQLRRFEQEFALASRLSHPNMIRYLDLGEHQEVPYLVMELIEGESLGQRIAREGRLPEADAVRLLNQVAQALEYAHAHGIVHRDVKPDNVLITADGTAKLTDLGLAKALSADLGITRPGKGLGTANYMAPEQFTNAKKAGARCDVYSLGATLYEAVTGQRPFHASTLWQVFQKKGENDLAPARQLVPELSEHVDRAIRRALSAEPNERPASCAEFVRALAGEPIASAVVGAPAPGPETKMAPTPFSTTEQSGAALPPLRATSAAEETSTQPEVDDNVDWWQWVAAAAMAIGAAVLSALVFSRLH